MNPINKANKLIFEQKIWHGWYSASSARLGGVAKYRSTTGAIVEITEVTRDNKPYSNWTDNVYVGEVVECIKGKDVLPEPKTEAEAQERLHKVLAELKREAFVANIRMPTSFSNMHDEKSALPVYNEQFRWN